MHDRRPCENVGHFRFVDIKDFDIEIEGDFHGNLGESDYKDKALLTNREKKKIIKLLETGKDLFEAVKEVSGKSVKIRKCYLIDLTPQ